MTLVVVTAEVVTAGIVVEIPSASVASRLGLRLFAAIIVTVVVGTG